MTAEQIAAWRESVRLQKLHSARFNAGFRLLMDTGWAPEIGDCSVWCRKDEVLLVSISRPDNTFTFTPGTKDDIPPL